MKLGLLTPVVSLNPRAHNAWEVDASVDDLVAVARAADDAGFHHLTCSEHVVVPRGVDGRRGTRYWDPLATLSHLAAVTTRIRLAPFVLVLPYHHPLEVVKRYGTLDRLSGGRVVLGVGVGSLQEEFELLGAPYDDRGAVTDERMDAIRRAWGRAEVDGYVLDPTPVQDGLTMWVGGRSRRSLRRAVELGDGWAPFGLRLDDVRSWLDDTPVPDGFEVVLWPEPPIDPIGEPSRSLDAIERARAAGATCVNLRFTSDSAGHCITQIHAAAELAGG